MHTTRLHWITYIQQHIYFMTTSASKNNNTHIHLLFLSLQHAWKSSHKKCQGQSQAQINGQHCGYVSVFLPTLCKGVKAHVSEFTHFTSRGPSSPLPYPAVAQGIETHTSVHAHTATTVPGRQPLNRSLLSLLQSECCAEQTVPLAQNHFIVICLKSDFESGLINLNIF